MSTGADCRFIQKGASWFYKIQDYPYGATDSYTEHGPFLSYRAAEEHLSEHYANPGGYSVDLDRNHPCNHPKSWLETRRDGSSMCGWCGTWITLPEQKPQRSDGEVLLHSFLDWLGEKHGWNICEIDPYGGGLSGSFTQITTPKILEAFREWEKEQKS